MKTPTFVLFIFALVAGCGSDTAPKMQQSAPQASVPAPAAKAADENATIALIRKINEEQANHFKINRRYALTFDELVEAHLLPSEPTSAQTGYEFKLRPAADAQTYKLSVDPADANSSARHFFTDQTGAIRAESGKAASADSPNVQ